MFKRIRTEKCHKVKKPRICSTQQEHIIPNRFIERSSFISPPIYVHNMFPNNKYITYITYCYYIFINTHIIEYIN